MCFSLSSSTYLMILSFRDFLSKYNVGLNLRRLRLSNLAQNFQVRSLFSLFHTVDISPVNPLICIHLFHICKEFFKQNELMLLGSLGSHQDINLVFKKILWHLRFHFGFMSFWLFFVAS